MKFTSRDLSLKRTPSKKQSGVFGVKINVVTKYENCPGFLDQKQKGHKRTLWWNQITYSYLCYHSCSLVFHNSLEYKQY